LISPKSFSKLLLAWSNDNPRIYPWSGEKDPYKIWISEIILQQTRSDQGKIYYEKFIKKYPTVKKLVRASEDEILNCWKGLGYYTRARNLYQAAKTIVEKFNGIFPKTFNEIKSLKGIGDYSAAAISSFAFNFPVAVVDGNVVRVFSRLLGIELNYNTSEGKRIFFAVANKYLNKHDPAEHNQAIMNFGAVQCKPKKPQCSVCPFSNICFAYLNQQIVTLPYKPKKKALIIRHIHYLHLENEKGEIAIRQRLKNDIWHKLYELPSIETKNDVILKDYAQFEISFKTDKLTKIHNLNLVGAATQNLSHQKINARFYRLKSNKIQTKIKQKFYFVKRENLVNFAFPKIISVYLENFNTK
jgi:A/G-specific adenine glycosylase